MVDGVYQSIMSFFIPYVVGEILPEALQGRQELGVFRIHVLKGIELFLNDLVVGPVSLRHGMAVGTVFLKSRIHDYLLGHRVAGEFPDELVLPAFKGGRVRSGHHARVVFFEFAVVMFDGVGDGAL